MLTLCCCRAASGFVVRVLCWKDRSESEWPKSMIPVSWYKLQGSQKRHINFSKWRMVVIYYYHFFYWSKLCNCNNCSLIRSTVAAAEWCQSRAAPGSSCLKRRCDWCRNHGHRNRHGHAECAHPGRAGRTKSEGGCVTPPLIEYSECFTWWFMQTCKIVLDVGYTVLMETRMCTVNVYSQYTSK